jgi:excinuclease ABC subunit A
VVAAACKREARHVKVGEGTQARAIFELSHLTLAECFDYFNTAAHGTVPKVILPPRWCAKSACGCKFLNDVGLTYLSLDRSAETLSGGESQRIRLASQIGSV